MPLLDINGIQRMLPHRYPFLLVDRIIELEPGQRAVGLKNVTINEPFFQGHYPQNPIMPGVLMVEAMAQVGGLPSMEPWSRAKGSCPSLPGSMACGFAGWSGRGINCALKLRS